MISQYPDDTPFFLNGSENSLRETLDVLQKFYEMSGLNINVEKQKRFGHSLVGELLGNPVTPQQDYVITID